MYPIQVSGEYLHYYYYYQVVLGILEAWNTVTGLDPRSEIIIRISNFKKIPTMFDFSNHSLQICYPTNKFIPNKIIKEIYIESNYSNNLGN